MYSNSLLFWGLGVSVAFYIGPALGSLAYLASREIRRRRNTIRLGPPAQRVAAQAGTDREQTAA